MRLVNEGTSHGFDGSMKTVPASAKSCAQELVQHGLQLGGAVKGDEEKQLALGRLNLRNINKKVAERAGPELLLHRLFALDLGRLADGVPLHTAVQ